ncbi:MAG: hypothetical protein LBK69_04355 [Syntrophomonadaceae bacterium]|jgi:hypothetical protein|nr:hypothetical protein [Syntrophomonadaceae bacterium]
MSYISATDLQKYSNVYSDAILQQEYIDAAENVVNNYLGYSPTLHLYNSVIDGKCSHELQLKAKPIQSLIGVAIDSAVIPTTDFYYTNDSEFIYYDKIFPYGNKNITAEYTAGWGVTVDDDENNGEYLPKIIKMTVLRIASMLQAESDSNIAVSSKSFADSGTRTFINYADYSKYLTPISIYRILVI